MALRATLGVDTSQVVSGQRVKCFVTVTNPTSGTSCNVTQVAPYITPATSSYNIGRPLLNLPEAPYYLAAGSSVTFTWDEVFFKGNDPAASQANATYPSYPITVGALVYASDGTITAAPTASVYVFPNVGVNSGSAFSLMPAGSTFFPFNLNAWLSGLLASPAW